MTRGIRRLWMAVIIQAIKDFRGGDRGARKFLFSGKSTLPEICELAGINLSWLRKCLRESLLDRRGTSRKWNGLNLGECPQTENKR